MFISTRNYSCPGCTTHFCYKGSTRQEEMQSADEDQSMDNLSLGQDEPDSICSATHEAARCTSTTKATPSKQQCDKKFEFSKDKAIPHIVCKEVPKQAQRQHAQSQHAPSQHAQSQHAQFARETTSQAGTHKPGFQAATSASSLVNVLVMVPIWKKMAPLDNL